MGNVLLCVIIWEIEDWVDKGKRRDVIWGVEGEEVDEVEGMVWGIRWKIMEGRVVWEEVV